MERERLDILIVERGLARSRTQAAALIELGNVLVNGVAITKPGRTVLTDAKIDITKLLPFISRAGQKLEHAISLWNIDITDLIVADIGASTGGFTDCLIQRGAKKVYAIDVGTGQLDQTLKNNPKVINLEQTDIRKIVLSEKVDLATIDVSFISLTLILPSVKNLLKEKASIITLIKPQFEVGPNNVDNGIVVDEEKRIETLNKIKEFSEKIGLKVKAETKSPITGATGNIEYLLWLSTY